MNTATITLTGGVNIEIVVTQLDTGGLRFDLKVLDDTGSTGDLNALFFDLADDGLADGLVAVGDDVTWMKFKSDGVTKIDNFINVNVNVNVNGEVVQEYGNFDSGVQFGTSGMAQDDIRETSFTLSHSDTALTLDMILGQDFAARLTSVGTEGGDHEDSLKIGGEAPTDPDTPPLPETVNDAIDDHLTVSNTAIFGEESGFEFLDGFATSVLENDTTDEFIYLGDVTAANGAAEDVGEIIHGSDGGLLIISANGMVDFSADGQFDYLTSEQTAETQFTYGIDGGDTATLYVTVSSSDGGGGGPLDGGDPLDDDPGEPDLFDGSDPLDGGDPFDGGDLVDPLLM